MKILKLSLVCAPLLALFAYLASHAFWTGDGALNSHLNPVLQSPESSRKAAASTGIQVNLLDFELTDQDGKKLLFKSGLIGNRIAVLIPFYTGCTTSFPILIFLFSKLQDLLNDHLGKDVVLISVTVDPSSDFPERLKSYSIRNKARYGWSFVTGEQKIIGEVLHGVGVLPSANLEDHNHIPVTVVGSADTEWRRFYGFPSPEQIMVSVNEFLASRR